MNGCPYCGVDLSARVTARWKFYLMGIRLRSANVYLREGRMRPKYRADREAAAWVIKSAVRRHGVTQARALRRVVFTRLLAGPGKLFDADNLSTAFKPIMDALVAEGVLVDDSPAHVRAWYRQRVGTRKGILVEIEDIE